MSVFNYSYEYLFKNNFDDKLSDAAVLSIINRMKQL